MELTGRIIAVLEERSGVSQRSGNKWMVKEYVFEVPGQYPRRCVFSVFGEERIKEFNIQNGEDLTIQFDIDARESYGRWYNDIKAYKIRRTSVQPAVTDVPQDDPLADMPFPLPIEDLGGNSNESYEKYPF